MIDYIISYIDLNIKDDHENCSALITKKKWVNKNRKVKVLSIPIYIKLTEDEYENIYQKKFLNETSFVEEKNAH